MRLRNSACFTRSEVAPADIGHFEQVEGGIRRNDKSDVRSWSNATVFGHIPA